MEDIIYTKGKIKSNLHGHCEVALSKTLPLHDRGGSSYSLGRSHSYRRQKWDLNQGCPRSMRVGGLG